MKWCTLKVGEYIKTDININANSMQDAVTEIQNKNPKELFLNRAFLTDFEILDARFFNPTNADREAKGQLVLTIPQRRINNENKK